MKKINLFTRSYPFGNTENFLISEIKIAHKLNLSLRIVPNIYEKNIRNCPFEIERGLMKSSFYLNIRIFLSLLISKWLWGIPFQKKPPKSFYHYFCAIKYLYAAFRVKHFLESSKDVFSKNDIYYSYWFNYICLGLVLAKIDNDYFKDIEIFSRGHGYDVFTETRGLYIPYRELMLSNVSKIFSVSEEGRKYLCQNYPQYESKIDISRLGVFSQRDKLGKREMNNSKIIVVSCSSVIQLKRVKLIYTSLCNYSLYNENVTIDWYHFGNGPLFFDLQKYVSEHKQKYINVHLLGQQPNETVISYYLKLVPHVFINVSLSEGIPVSIMEAISLGIPIIATNVGGTKEIVNNDTGCLLDVNFTMDTFMNALDFILSDSSLHERSYSFFQKYYDAEINYMDFYDKIGIHDWN